MAPVPECPTCKTADAVRLYSDERLWGGGRIQAFQCGMAMVRGVPPPESKPAHDKPETRGADSSGASEISRNNSMR